MEPRARLEKALRDLLERDRQSLVDQFKTSITNVLQGFLDRRAPNKSLYEVYGDDRFTPEGLRVATTYYEAEKALYDSTPYWGVQNPDTRPAFEVTWKPDAEASITMIAERQVEAIIQTFIDRSLEKLGPVVDREPEAQFSLQGNFSSFVWAGEIFVSCPKALTFLIKVKIITNRTKYGDLYPQYPFTIHEVFQSGKRLLIHGIEDLWSLYGYKPSKEPVLPRKRWSKVVSGSVLFSEGKFFLLQTPGVIKKLGINLDQWEQVGRIDAGRTSAHLERFDGTTQHHQYTEEERTAQETLERAYKFNQAQALRREQAFKVFYKKTGVSGN